MERGKKNKGRSNGLRSGRENQVRKKTEKKNGNEGIEEERMCGGKKN